jgi:hypothetical protein
MRGFKNRVLRRLFGPKRDEATGEWRKIHNDELHDLYSSLTIVGVIRSRTMRWVGHYLGWGGERWGNLKERDYWGDPGVDGRIILRCIFRK